MEGKLLITSYGDKMISVFYRDGKALEVNVENSSLIGAIFLARVSSIVQNIEAAFLGIVVNNEKTQVFYNLKDNKIHNFADKKEHVKLVEGDEIVVQITRDAVKTKVPNASAHLAFAGQYAVVSRGRGKLCFSSKIKDTAWKKEVAEGLRKTGSYTTQKTDSDIMESVKCNDVLIRTSSFTEKVSMEEIFEEILSLEKQLLSLLSGACYKKAPALLHHSEAKYVSLCKKYKPIEVITDDESVFDQILRLQMKETKVKLYRDQDISLEKLYSVQTLMDSLLQKRVWMKSGAYLVIEYTEAMTVIDVNSGKIDIQKEPEEVRLRVNLEAAVCAMEQIRLRNISGIIVIDFIDMKKENRVHIFSKLEELAKEDRIKTNIVDFTSLGLVEITRQRNARPIYDEIKGER